MNEELDMGSPAPRSLRLPTPLRNEIKEGMKLNDKLDMPRPLSTPIRDEIKEGSKRLKSTTSTNRSKCLSTPLRNEIKEGKKLQSKLDMPRPLPTPIRADIRSGKKKLRSVPEETAQEDPVPDDVLASPKPQRRQKVLSTPLRHEIQRGKRLNNKLNMPRPLSTPVRNEIKSGKRKLRTIPEIVVEETMDEVEQERSPTPQIASKSLPTPLRNEIREGKQLRNKLDLPRPLSTPIRTEIKSGKVKLRPKLVPVADDEPHMERYGLDDRIAFWKQSFGSDVMASLHEAAQTSKPKRLAGDRKLPTRVPTGVQRGGVAIEVLPEEVGEVIREALSLVVAHEEQERSQEEALVLQGLSNMQSVPVDQVPEQVGEAVKEGVLEMGANLTPAAQRCVSKLISLSSEAIPDLLVHSVTRGVQQLQEDTTSILDDENDPDIFEGLSDILLESRRHPPFAMSTLVEGLIENTLQSITKESPIRPKRRRQAKQSSAPEQQRKTRSKRSVAPPQSSEDDPEQELPVRSTRSSRRSKEEAETKKESESGKTRRVTRRAAVDVEESHTSPAVEQQVALEPKKRTVTRRTRKTAPKVIELETELPKRTTRRRVAAADSEQVDSRSRRTLRSATPVAAEEGVVEPKKSSRRSRAASKQQLVEESTTTVRRSKRLRSK
jgi:hypothetical protein